MTAEHSPSSSNYARQEYGQLMFTPTQELRQRIAAFYNPSAKYAPMGRHGLFLYSDLFDTFTHSQAPMPPESATRRREGEALQRASNLTRILKERSHVPRALAPKVEFGEDRRNHELWIRFDVLIDELARRAMQEMVFLQNDTWVAVHARIPNQKMERGHHLLGARDKLVNFVVGGEKEARTIAMEYVTNRFKK